MNLTELSPYQLLEDLKEVDYLLWLYNLALQNNHPQSNDGVIDYQEHYDKMIVAKKNIVIELARRKEDQYVQFCK